MRHLLRSAILIALYPVAMHSMAQVPVLQISGVSSDPSQDLYQSSQSEMVQVLFQLQEEVRQLRGELETMQHKVDRLETDSRDRYRDVDRRISVLMQAALENEDAAFSTGGAASPSPSVDIGSGSTAAPSSTASTSSTSSPSTSSQPSQAGSGLVSDQAAYASAFELVRERKFDEALKAFEAFVVTYPNKDSTANGYYWIGELHLAQQNPEKARAAFEKVMVDFPSHHKIPDTLYKLGVTYSQLGEHERARNVLSLVISEYPQSTAASLAQSFRPAVNN